MVMEGTTEPQRVTQRRRGDEDDVVMRIRIKIRIMMFAWSLSGF
jgi:hypothetical protein